MLVNGTFPLLGNYGELGLGDSLTMPVDWPALANAMATTPEMSPEAPLFGAIVQSTCAAGIGTNRA